MNNLLNFVLPFKKIILTGLLFTLIIAGNELSAAAQKLQTLKTQELWKELRSEAQKQLDSITPDDPRAGKYWDHLLCGVFEGNEAALYDDLFQKYAAGKFAENASFFAYPWQKRVLDCGFGFIIDNNFKRGANRGNAGRMATSFERDRIQQLALMSALVPKVLKEGENTHTKHFFCRLASLLLQNRNSGSSYKLQTLSDLKKLPDYGTPEGDVSTSSRPPVKPDGTPLFYKLPASWDVAANDGERLRFAIAHADCKEAELLWADFLCGQFDFLTVNYRFRQEYYLTPAMKQYLYNLKDNETVAELVNGTRRITLPEEFNYIELYKKLGKHERLGEIYASRMQFEKAISEFEQVPSRKNIVDQLKNSWGKPDEMHVTPAHTGLTIPYHFRNAGKLTVKLYKVDMTKAMERLLEMLKNPESNSYLISQPFSDNKESKKFWNGLISKTPEIVRTFDLSPLPHHWESIAYLKFGKFAPGVFAAEFIPDNNEKSRVYSMIWNADYALTLQQGAGNGKFRLFVNDPVSGRPIPGVTLKIYSYYLRYGSRRSKQRQSITPEVTTLKTDENGIAEFSKNIFKQPPKSYIAARYIIAETPAGKLTLLNCSYFDSGIPDSPNESPRTFVITDKNIYKPGDKIALTGYWRRPSYDGKMSVFKGKSVTLVFFDPQYKKAFQKTVPFDAKSQSFTFEVTLPDDAMLGEWQVNCRELRFRTMFQVEEYKRPEYLLTVTPPDKPVKAGTKIPVSIEAKYYFGAPVANAEVAYKVYRSETTPLYPFAFLWNWLYGDRYAICTATYQTPGVRNINYGRVLICDTKGRTDAKGVLKFEIDSADALARFGNKDFRYTVEAEVKDSTNRIVSTSGSVIAAVKPFAVHLYTPWGFARTGSRYPVEVKAVTPDGKPVKGRGVLQIFRRILNKDGVPARTGAALKTIHFTLGDGKNSEFILNEEGVYELYAEVTSENGITVSESMPIFIVGEKQGTSLFGEYPITVSSDKPTYRPGETAQLLVSCDRPGRTVYFITRSEREAKLECVTLNGYSKLFSIPIEKGDQPNFFVDVMSYQDGKMLTLQKQLFVPPEKKVLNVAVSPKADKVKPGTCLPVEIAVTTLDGKPISGNVTVAVYDKSLEALAPNSILAISPFFWDWKRHDQLHFLHNFSTSTDISYNREMMQNIENSFALPFHNDAGVTGAWMFRQNRMMLAKSVDAAMPAPAAEAKQVEYLSSPVAMRALGASEAIPSADRKAAPVILRKNFRDRAFWAGRIELPASGKTMLNIPLPDDLTTWVVRVWSLTSDTRVGEAKSEILVSKDLIARLELPRFMVSGDTVDAVVNINNTSNKDLGETAISLIAPGLLKGMYQKKVTLKANGNVTFNVPLTASAPGEYTLTLSAKNRFDSDALELKLPVLVKGIDKQVNFCGRLDEKKKKTVITLDIPEQRKKETTAFALHLSPGAAKNMVELLPYLAADDSGDVFGVVNRFLPALSAKLALQKLNVNWEDAVGGKTARDPLYAEYMQRYTWNGNAVPTFKATDFDRVIKTNLQMISNMVNRDGGWGWFGAYREQSWPDTTAYVVDALLELQNKKYRSLIENGISWLEKFADKRLGEIKKYKSVNNTDALVARVLAKAGKPHKELMELCYKYRAKSLAPYGYAMLALAYGKDTAESKMLIRNLEQFLKVDDENNTAYLNIPSSCCFFWYGDENETLSAYLELLLRNDPKSVTAQKVANYLVTNVRNSPWRNSTRSLGAAVRALAKYIVVSGEGQPDFTVTIRTKNAEHKYTFNAQNMWQNDNPALFIPAGQLKSGRQNIEIEFSGKGALYWNGMLNYFTLEENIPPAGLEMQIKRNYYLLRQDNDAAALLAGKDGAAVSEKVLKYKRILLKDGDTVNPGDLVEVELISTAKNDYDYVVFQDAMPSGFEYVNPASGWMWQWSSPMYAEYKERGAKFYLRNMARGKSNAFYRIRAQLCGKVTALPAKGYGIYAPELKCNSSQQILQTVR